MWVSKPEQLKAMVEQLEAADLIAVDTEFIRESTFYPQLEIIQIATDKDVWIVDARAFPRARPPHETHPLPAETEPLRRIFENPKVLKCMHASLGDQECLLTYVGVVAKPIFDTAVAAALLGYGENVGLGALLKAELGIHVPKGLSRTHWSHRPLPENLIKYAEEDVLHLVAMSRSLLGKLKEKVREAWALELSQKIASRSMFEMDADALAGNLARGGRVDAKHFGTLLELVRWRERRVREMNLPRRWLADDRTLMDLVKVQPRSLDQLFSFRGLHQGEVKKNGEQILAAIERGKSQQVPLPKREHSPHSNEAKINEDARSLQLMRCFLGVLADEAGISAKYLVPQDQWGRAIHLASKGEIKKTEDLIRLNLIGPEMGLNAALAWVGDSLVDFLCGRTMLSLQGEKICVEKKH